MKKESKKDQKKQELDGQIEKVYSETSDDSAPKAVDEKEAVKQEKKAWKFKRKVKRGFKALRFRKLKNFFLWFAGVISGLAILFSAVFIAIGVVPVKTLVGDDSSEIVSEDLGNMSALGLIMSFNDYIESYSSITEAFPIIDKTVTDLLGDLGEYVEVDLDAVKDIPFSSKDFTEKLFGSVRIVATLESLGVAESLGDFGDLPIFKNDPALNDSGVQYTVATIDDSADDFMYKLYNYYDEAQDKYLSASNVDGNGWVEGIANNEPLFYASLTDMPFSDLADVVADRMGVVQVKGLIETFSPGASEGIIGDILGDTDIAGMGEFTIDNVKLSAFIERYEEGSDEETQIYSLLRTILNVEDDEEILISHFTEGEFSFDDVKISEFIDRYKEGTTEETDIYRLMRKIFNIPDSEEIKVSHLSGDVSFDEVEISEFIDRYKEGTTEETDIYRLMRKIFNVPDSEEIKVSHLSGDVNFDEVEISEFIDRYKEGTTEETDIYRLMRSIFNVPDGEEIKVSHLSGDVNFDEVKVSEFVDRWTDGFMITETESYKTLRKLTGVNSGEIYVKDLTDSLDGGIELSPFIKRYEDGSTEETTIYKILRSAFNIPTDRDITIDDIGGEFDADKIDLSIVVDESENEKLFEIIRSATNKGATDTVYVGDMGSFDADDIDLSIVVDESENEKLFEIIRSATNKGATDTVYVGDMSSFDADKIDLSIVVDESENQKLFEIIRSSTGKGETETVYVGDLDNFNVNLIKLESVIDRYESDGVTQTKLFDILSQTTVATGDDGAILVGDMANFNINNLKLETVIDRYESDGVTQTKLFDILSQTVVGSGPDGAILVGDMTGFNVDGIELETVIDRYETDGVTETKLWTILSQAVNAGVDGVITVGELSDGFDIGSVELSNVIDKYESDGVTKTKLWKILEETVVGTGEAGALTVNDLSGFNVETLTLNTIITEEQRAASKVLDALLKHDGVTVGNIDERIDSLDISEVFGAECFTTDQSKAVVFTNPNMGKYKKVVNPNETCTTCEAGHCTCETFVLIEDPASYTGEIYYVSKDAQMWLFLYYDDAFGDGDGTTVSETDFNYDGFALKYKPMHVTFGTFDDKVDKMSEEIEHATVRQLVQVGFVPVKIVDGVDIYEEREILGETIYTYKKSLSEAIG